jgi:hypothetical protein
MIDITTKKIEELEFTRGKDVIFISGNMNNEYLIIVLKNGNIYAIDNNHNVKHFKNLIVNSVLFENSKSKSKDSSTTNTPLLNENFKMFSSHSLDKLVIANQSYLTIWYKNELIKEPTSKLNLKKSVVEELSGTFYNISLENEKKALLSSDDFSKKNFIETISAVFGNNYFLGSFGRIIYTILMPTDIQNLNKLYLIDYLFRYENCNKFKTIQENGNVKNNQTSNEYVRNIEKKVVYSYLTYSTEMSKENEIYTTNKERIIQKFNTAGNCCAIMINCQYALNSTLMIYMTETCRFSTYKLFDLYTKVKQPKNEANKIFIWVEDLDWICNDMFLVLILSQGYFAILNVNFQLINFIDTSGSLVKLSGGNISTSPENFSCASYIYNQKLKLNDKLSLLTSKKRTDYFIIYNANYSICFQANYKTYESRLLSLNTVNETFDDFLYILKYFQIYHNENDSAGLFDKIHNYMVKCLKELYHTETEQTMPNENVSYIFSIFVKFIRIFRSINQIHETNLTILSYLIGVSNDFFYHLINFKEIWLAFLFIDICENYLLKHLRLKVSRNKLCDEQLSKGQNSYMCLNPYFGQNPSLKCYNKIINKVLHSRLRLILLIFALIEFRNNQALNINVLYFVLAKLCIDKLKKHNLLDDVQLIVKVVIRNWKYLKNENQRAGGEEYILNGLTMNYRTEILSQFIHSRSSRDDIKFDFFSDFLPLDGLQDFIELHETYCKGEEESLVNEYNYINNIGIIQRWILFFTNCFNNYLFEDIKNYVTNHVKQTLLFKKEAENISPEETNLSSLIYFNVVFFLLGLNTHIKFFLKTLSGKIEYTGSENNISQNSQDETKVLSDFSKILMPFISPIDVPFIIFEFYSIEDNKNKKNLPYEINMNLNALITSYVKSYNFSLNDTLDFIEFLQQNGFKNYMEIENYSDEVNAQVDEEELSNQNNQTNLKDQNQENKINDLPLKNENNHYPSKIHKMQKFKFSSLLFYLFNIHKLNQIHFLEQESDMIISTIENLHPELKSEIYEFLLLTLNGTIRHYLSKENSGTMNQNLIKYFETTINFMKSLFYKIVREEPSSLCSNLPYEIVQISPECVKAFLLEGALFYKYKNLNKFVKGKLFDCSNLLEVSTGNYLNIQSKKIPNIFEEFTKEKRIPLFDVLLCDKSTIDPQVEYTNFSAIIKNIVLLNKVNVPVKKSNKEVAQNSKLIFTLEENTEFIRKIILSELVISNNNDDAVNSVNTVNILETIISVIDNILKINLPKSPSLNQEVRNKLSRSVKLELLKSLHIFNLVYVKYKCFFSLNPQKEILQYINQISYCLLFGSDNHYKQNFNNALKILDYLLLNNTKDLKENDKNTFIEIIKSISLFFIKLKRNISVNPKMIELEEKLKTENKDLYVRMKNLISSEEMEKIREVYRTINCSKVKSNNLKDIIMLLFLDSYWDNMKQVYSQMENYVKDQNTKNPLRNARKRYLKYSESYMELTGIPVKNFIDFKDNWQITAEEDLFYFIINDDFDLNTFHDDGITNIILDRRQRHGFDSNRKMSSKTRKESNEKIMNLHLPRKIEEENFNKKLTGSPSVNISFSSKDLNSSIDLREESDVQCHDAKIASKVIKIQQKSYDELKRDKSPFQDRDDTSTNTVVIMKKNKNGNEIKIMEENQAEENDDKNKSTLPVLNLCNSIVKVFFGRFKQNLFIKYKEQITKKELEEIKIYNIKPKEGTFEVVVLKEKYVRKNDFEKYSIFIF